MLSSNGSDNGLVPNRQQTIIWTNINVMFSNGNYFNIMLLTNWLILRLGLIMFYWSWDFGVQYHFYAFTHYISTKQ